MNAIDIDINNNFNDNLCMSDEELSRIIDSAEKSGVNTLTPAITFFDDDPDSKPYLLLLTMYPSSDSRDNIDEIYKDWSISIGRQHTYDYLKEMVKNELIDPNLSFIITGSKDDTTITQDVIFDSKAITVYRFLKVMHENHKVLDDEEFDIDLIYDPYSETGEGDKSILDV